MSRLRVGLVGTGSVVREIYQHFYFSSAYSSTMSVEGICDLQAAEADAFGEAHGIPASRRFSNVRDMIAACELDVLAVNTPDRFHLEPVLLGLEAGLDIFVPKPLSDSIKDAHAMIQAARKHNRFIGVDFHKREDPRLKEARARIQENAYGTLQSSVWYMLDKLLVADPNHEPRFFATPDFATRNTPVSFLTVHMADAFMYITGLKPVEVRATGYKQKLPSLQPVPVNGYDLVNTEVLFENGCVSHFFTGWAVPNAAHATTVQSARLLGSEGLLDLNLDRPGYHEILSDGIFERNPLFRNFEEDGSVSGYGMSSPGRIMNQIARFRSGTLEDHQYETLMSPIALGFYTSVICEAAHQSLENANETAPGAWRGAPVRVDALVKHQIGEEAAQPYF